MSSDVNVPATPGSEFFPLPPECIPDVESLVIEDGVPVETIFAEKQYRLLTEPLYTSWPGPGEGRPFVVLANVGLFFAMDQPPLAPDVMLSLDVQVKDRSCLQASEHANFCLRFATVTLLFATNFAHRLFCASKIFA